MDIEKLDKREFARDIFYSYAYFKQKEMLDNYCESNRKICSKQ